jgi:polyhydroxybutyrate depolymerase
VPLLVALHGGTGWGTQFERNSGFDGLAEANGFIVVYPDGIGAGPGGRALRTWNGGYCCGPAARDAVDDVGYLRRLVDTLSAEQPIDPDRVFVTGHSNGAILGYRLACELADRIAAVAVQAGSLGVDDCRPARPVPLLHLHGTADRNHPIEGGTGDGISGTDFHPAIDGVRAIAAADGCPPEGTAVRRSDNPDVAVTTWGPCRDGAEVQLVTVEGASHAWMGHAALAPRMTGEAYPDLDASAEVWAFLAAHPRRAG